MGIEIVMDMFLLWQCWCRRIVEVGRVVLSYVESKKFEGAARLDPWVPGMVVGLGYVNSGIPIYGIPS